MGEQKTTVEGLNTKIADLERTKGELEGKIASGSGDKDLIASQKATIEKLTGEYNTLKGEKDKMEADHKAALLDMKIGTELNMALNEIAFKQDANPEIVNAMKKLAIDSLKSETKPTYITDDQGAERLIFKDANGAEMRNKNNGLNFYTAKELLTEQLSKYGIVDDGKPAGGAGGGGSTPKPRTNISGARSKREFMEMAENTLHGKGLVFGTPEYQAELDRIVDDNGAVFDALPQE